MPLSAHEFERRLIFYASPTLTKLKVACMYNLNDLDDLEECIDYYNEILNKKDIYLKVLSIKGRSMIYVYQKEKLNKLNNTKMMICICKTPMSITDDKLNLGYPKDFKMTVTDIKVYNGAGFIVVYMGNVLLMPGMPKNPNYLNMNINE